MVNRGEEKVRVHLNVVPRSTRNTNSGTLRRDSPSLRPCSSVGRVTEDLIRRSWVRFPPRSKDFSLPLVVPCFPLLGLTPSGLFMGLSSTLIYTSELILCSRGGGGYSQKKWVGVCGPLPKTLTLFMSSLQANLGPKFAIFPTLFMSY